ncbi:MAG: hypothetical protein JSS06_08185 [Proteobacteria bacterium]|nr:hypothetical protein [Pseudomonadota bacterium]
MDEMKHDAHGTQQPGHVNEIDKEANAAQPSDSLAWSINQHLLKRFVSEFNGRKIT